MQTINPVVLASIREQYFATSGRSERKAVIEEAANHYGVSYATMNRQLNLNVRTRSLSHKEQERIAELNRLGKAVWDFQQLMSTDLKKINTRSAHRHLRSMGQIPGWFTEKMCYDAIDRQHLKNLAEPTFKRFERDHAHSLYQIDFTKSDYLRAMDDGSILVTAQRYSRDVSDDYIWIGSAVDDASRASFCEYIVTPGESATVTQRFIVRSLEAKPGMMLLQGMPRELYVDRGPGFQAGATTEGLRRLGIHHISGQNHVDQRGQVTNESNKQGRGKVEALNKVVKSSFEQDLYLKHNGHRFTIHELNAMLAAWMEEHNQAEHPTRIGLGKWNMFAESLKTCAFPPANALALFSKSMTVRVARRMIRVAKNDYYLAPAFVDDGAVVEISKRQDECFMTYQGSEIKLVPQETPNAWANNDQAKAKRKVPTRKEILAQLEKPTDTYMGITLKDRFDTELRNATAGELRLQTIPDELYGDIKPFFSEQRTLAEIREKVDYVKMQIMVPRQLAPEGSMPQAMPVRRHSKIIHMQPIAQ